MCSAVAPSFKRKIMDQKVKVNCGAMFMAEITNPAPASSSPLKVSWLLNGEKVSRDVSKRFLTKFDPKTGKAVLTIADCTIHDEGQVKCVVDNQHDVVECSSNLKVMVD
ncbi:titin-like isoform X2 [Convolutriloba macropyga]|uniref:titin-like isoform X2 n=1 Tax=Convolutriloba macropyga TaxID=536237 RepID=UPI003F522DBC